MRQNEEYENMGNGFLVSMDWLVCVYVSLHRAIASHSQYQVDLGKNCDCNTISLHVNGLLWTREKPTHSMIHILYNFPYILHIFKLDRQSLTLSLLISQLTLDCVALHPPNRYSFGCWSCVFVFVCAVIWFENTTRMDGHSECLCPCWAYFCLAHLVCNKTGWHNSLSKNRHQKSKTNHIFFCGLAIYTEKFALNHAKEWAESWFAIWFDSSENNVKILADSIGIDFVCLFVGSVWCEVFCWHHYFESSNYFVNIVVIRFYRCKRIVCIR